ncbi:hypothetical protein BGZ70_006547 [Mortierella alpina]|uniref:Uncharacterized protein n=1 Tax=Mortierella alpina TaxID=64518 RepID=A0A9P6J7N8_MORAP|nr:hypothetical protein BGZ70_006547 [Mortierella alpina]
MSMTRTLGLIAVLTYSTTCLAAVWSTDPVAETHWKIGAPADIHWKLNSPTSKKDNATIYLVGGDYTAYKRLATLGKGVVLGTHKLTVPKVPEVDCGASCALEFVIESGPGMGDFYSHNFTISTTGLAIPGNYCKLINLTIQTPPTIAAPKNPSQTGTAPAGPAVSVYAVGTGSQTGGADRLMKGAMALMMTVAVSAVTLTLL